MTPNTMYCAVGSMPRTTVVARGQAVISRLRLILLVLDSAKASFTLPKSYRIAIFLAQEKWLVSENNDAASGVGVAGEKIPSLT